jgi:hypothetical protein
VPASILADVTDAPWQPGQPAHPDAGADPAGGEAVTPAWPIDTTMPLPRTKPDGWQPGPEPLSIDEPWVGIPRPGRTHRTAVVVLSVILGLVLAGSGGLTWYLLRVNAAWQQHSQELEALAEQRGTDLAQAQSDLEETRTELKAVQDQLATAQTRITQLANEKAQLGDESAAQQQLADYQHRVSQAAGQVASALSNCIDGQEQLIQFIQTSSQWDPAQLATYRQDVENYCGSARSANTALQAELAK